MGAKTWMLVGSDTDARAAFERLLPAPVLDRAASLKLVQSMFPQAAFTEQEDGSLDFTNPPDDEVYVGCFDGVAVVAAGEFGLDYPSQLPAHFREALPYRTVLLHAMHSVVDWFAFAIWRDGQLLRALSLSPESGILEDIGERLPFEQPFWAGERPLYEGDDEPGDDGDWDDEDAGDEEAGNEFEEGDDQPGAAAVQDADKDEEQDNDEPHDYPFVFHPLELAEAALGQLFGYVLEGPIADSAFDAEDVPLMTFKR